MAVPRGRAKRGHVKIALNYLDFGYFHSDIKTMLVRKHGLTEEEAATAIGAADELEMLAFDINVGPKEVDEVLARWGIVD